MRQAGEYHRMMENSAESADIDDVTMLIGGIEELFKRLPVALYRSAPNGELLAANPALAALLGYESSDDLFARFESVESVYVDPGKRELWLNQISEAGEVHDFDVELRRRDGSTVWVQDTARAVYDEEGRLIYCEGALLDVTEKVKAKKARDEFVATVSHELRNPISVLLGLAQELASDYDGFSDAERREICDVMARQADDASWIIEDLLVAYREDMSRVTVFSESFEVVDEVQRVLESFDADIALRVESDSTAVIADPRRTRQILRNLVSNAIRYGGSEILVRVRREGGSVAVDVCDSGPALDADEAQRIFESYERGSGLLDAKSVGLGLSVARKLAGLMNGYLDYRHDGQYSSFIVTLPAAP
ncbi:MAG TPA: PAS domain-containing sensor histidine kinase [Acidimicrobiia bacterium]|nr:PAS domain-containing sensor histidine kinase [Acidimicrobiia bacterium]